MQKENYAKPFFEVFEMRNLSFLEYFSGNGDVDQFGDGGDLGEGGDVLDINQP